MNRRSIAGRVLTVVLAASLTISLNVVFAPGSKADGSTSPEFVVPDLNRKASTLPADLAAGDFNADGASDVAVANLGPDVFTGGVTVILGDGTGNLGAQLFTPLGANEGAREVAAGDFNGDGATDVAVLMGTFSYPGAVRILLG